MERKESDVSLIFQQTQEQDSLVACLIAIMIDDPQASIILCETTEIQRPTHIADYHPHRVIHLCTLQHVKTLHSTPLSPILKGDSKLTFLSRHSIKLHILGARAKTKVVNSRIARAFSLAG